MKGPRELKIRLLEELTKDKFAIENKSKNLSKRPLEISQTIKI